MQKNSKQSVSNSSSRPAPRFLALLAVSLTLAFILGSLNLQSAQATPIGPVNPTRPELGYKIFLPMSLYTEVGWKAPVAAPLAAAAETTGACGTNRWLDVPGGAITIRGTVDGSSETAATNPGQLTLENGQVVSAFCTDFHHPLGDNQTLCLDDEFFSDWRVSYLISHYPPTTTDRIEQAARQGAVWNLTDGFTMSSDATTENSTTDRAVKSRYDALLLEVNSADPGLYQPGNIKLEIESTNGVIPELNTFYPAVARLTKGNTPLKGVTLNLTVSDGVLDIASGTTDVNGELAFQIKRSTNGTATVTATTTLNLPAGSRFNHQTSPTTNQRLVIANEAPTSISAQASIEFLSGTNQIIAHKFEDLNNNGVQDAGEENLRGVTFKLYVGNSLKATQSTNANGKAIFSISSWENKTYSLRETVPDGYRASTPTQQDRVRSASDPWKFWIAEFGNSPENIIKVIKFLDLDEDGEKDANEPPLPGVQFELRDNNGTLGGGMTDANGQLSFTGLSNKKYTVIERLPVGYESTTGLEQSTTFSWLTDNYKEFFFGNRTSFGLRAFKFIDKDLNGIYSAGDEPKPGWTLCRDGDCLPTDENGFATWYDASATTHTISETLPAGWISTTPLSQQWASSYGQVSTYAGPLSTDITIPDGTKFNVALTSHEGNTWTYTVTRLAGKTSLSHWMLGIAACQGQVASYTPTSGYSFGKDGNRPFVGAKWNGSEGVYSITLKGNYPLGSVDAMVKAGAAEGGFALGQIAGPVCGPQFGNVPLAQLTLKKTVDWGGMTPDSAQTFTICATGVGGPADGKKLCNTFGSNGGSYTFPNVTPGRYLVQENSVSSVWTVTGSQVYIDVPANGATYTHDVTNRYTPGAVTVTKSVDWKGVTQDPNQKFKVCLVGPTPATTEVCKDFGATGGSLTWDKLIPGSYSLYENTTLLGSGWAAPVVSPASLTVTSGQTATATISNVHLLGNLEVTKVVDWNGAPAEYSKSFSICISGPSYSTPNCKSVQYTSGAWTKASWANLKPGSYTVTETDPGTGWQKTIAGSPVTIVADGSTNRSVTVTNQRQWGSLEVTKSLNWKGISSSATFQICLTSPTFSKSCQNVTQDGQKVTWNYLTPGSYTLTEEGVGSEWDVVISHPTVTILGDKSVTKATISNTHKVGSLTVNKAVVWNGLTPDNRTFNICLSGPSFSTPSCAALSDKGSKTWNDLIPGDYTVSETPGNAWSVTITNSLVTVPATGGSFNAAVTNSYRLGELLLNKKINWQGITPFTQSFDLCITGPSFPTTPNCKSVTGEGQARWTNLLPGIYKVTEQNLPANWVATAGANGTEVTVAPATQATQDVTNTYQPASLTVSKTVAAGNVNLPDGLSFNICLVGPKPATTEQCKSLSASAPAEFSPLVPGKYTVYEKNLGAMWSAEGSDVEIDLVSGSNRHSLTNTVLPGSLRVSKSAVWAGAPVDPSQTFEFCITGPSYPASTCQTSTYSAASGGFTDVLFTDLFPGSYTVSEAPAGAFWSVDDGEISLEVVAEEEAQHTFTNTLIPANLVIHKAVDWMGAPVLTDQVFELCITGPSYPTTPECKTSSWNSAGQAYTDVTFGPLVPGEYTLTETDLGLNWTRVSNNSKINVTAGSQPVEFTFQNRINPASLTVNKVVDFAGIPTDTAQTFQFCISGPSYPTTPKCLDSVYDATSQSWKAVTFAPLFPGVYTVSENVDETIWNVNISKETVTLLPSGSETTTVTNTRKLGSLKVSKAVAWNGVTPKTATFEICISGPSFPNGDCQTLSEAGGDLLWSDLIPGAYTVSENVDEAVWNVAIDSATVTVPTDGGQGTASITNTYRVGSLKVSKVIHWQNVTPQPALFSICISGPSFPNGDCQTLTTAGELTWTDLDPGQYTVTETNLGEEWQASGSGVDVVVVADEETAHTLTNTYQPGKIIIHKVVQANGTRIPDTQTFTFCIAGPQAPAQPAHMGGGSNCGTSVYDPNTGTWTDVELSPLAIGTYTVIEQEPGSMWTVENRESEVQVLAGGTATTTVTNTIVTGSLTVNKVVDWSGAPADTSKSFEFCITGPSSPAGDTCLTSTYDVESSSWLPVTFNSLFPGQYTVTETDPSEDWYVEGSAEIVVVEPALEAQHTITNTLYPTRLVVEKAVEWNGTTPDLTQTFEFCITGPSSPNGELCGTSSWDAELLNWSTVEFDPIVPGTYIVTETAPGSFWTVEGSGEAVDVLLRNEVTWHTITNNFQAASLTINKVVDFAGIPTDTTQTFEFCITGPSSPNGDTCLTSSYDGQSDSWLPVTFDSLIPGDYTVTENLGELAAMWTVEGSGARVNAPIGGQASHTITNTRKLGSLIITKNVVWNGVTPTEQLFEICINGPSFPEAPNCQTLTQAGQLTWENLLPGNYSVTENADTSLWTVDIATSPVVVPTDGTAANVTVTNTHKLASLIVTKVVTWVSPTPDTNKTFEICVSGPSFAAPSCESVDYDGGELVWNDLIPGVYTVTETNPGAIWTVTGSGVTVNVTLEAQATHTITNKENPKPPVIDLLPDLTATKSDILLVDSNQDGKVNSKDTLQYTVVVTNSGEGDALAVVFKDSPDANTTLVAGSVTTSQGTITKGNSEGDKTIEVTLGKIAAKGGTATITFNVTINNPLAPEVKSVANQGWFTGDNFDPTPTDDPDTPNSKDPTLTPIVVVPTAVDSLSLSIQRFNWMTIQLTWQTQGEVDTVGFNLYRSRTNDKHTAELVTTVQAQGSAEGHTYLYQDIVQDEGQWYYWISDIDSNGQETWRTDNGLMALALQMKTQLFLPFIR